jgi:hypothetical protein
MFQSVGAAAFFAAWQGLNQTGPNTPLKLPHYRDAFQHMPSELLPHIAIVEETANDVWVIRFLGTWRVEMWGDDLTGTDPLVVMPPPVAAASRRNMQVMLTHPCGMSYLAHYITPSGREVSIESITMPIGNDPGLPRRMINYVEELATIGYGDPLGAVSTMEKRTWLDIGAGVPKKAPAK